MISAKDQFSARNLISQVANFFREIQYTYVATNWFPLRAPQFPAVGEPPTFPTPCILGLGVWDLSLPHPLFGWDSFLLLLVFINKGIASMNG